ncbi:hypothetical protein [Marinobacter halophilus]|uniref:hypothetical protein n=1 Tax=Marinobacter halophilus TaxID=1323740 RepID=UPI0013FD98B1|nr:hypothetical protein [Marinobacter halophilus]
MRAGSFEQRMSLSIDLPEKLTGKLLLKVNLDVVKNRLRLEYRRVQVHRAEEI